MGTDDGYIGSTGGHCPVIHERKENNYEVIMSLGQQL